MMPKEVDACELNEEVYAVLRENLVAVKSSYAEKDVVLCPVCLREIGKAEVLKGGIEHIIPQVVANEDAPTTRHKLLGTRDVASLCCVVKSASASGMERTARTAAMA